MRRGESPVIVRFTLKVNSKVRVEMEVYPFHKGSLWQENLIHSLVRRLTIKE
jgi:uncharacterized protein (UPF0548 family)